MSQMPPPPGFPGSGPYAPQPPMPMKQTNGWAITSLVCGLLGCAGGVTGILAVIFGLVGIKKSNRPNGSGKALSIVGLLLGLIFIVIWAMVGIGALHAYQRSAQARAFTEQFIHDLATGNSAAAESRCDASVTPAEIEQAIATLKTKGVYQRSILIGFGMPTDNGQPSWAIGGAATFDKDSISFNGIVKQEDDGLKISEFHFDNKQR